MDTNRRGNPLTVKESLLAAPEIPVSLRYFDDYHRRQENIPNARAASFWVLKFHGQSVRINFASYPIEVEPFVRSFGCWLLGHVHPATTYIHLSNLQKNPTIASQVFDLAVQSRSETKKFWYSTILQNGLSLKQILALKKVLIFLCEHSIGSWSTVHLEWLKSLPTGITTDKLSAVRDGGAFLSTQEEATLVAYFDDLSEIDLADRGVTPDRELAVACCLYWIFSHGVRPIQIASLDMEDLNVLPAPNSTPAIHVRFSYAKQRTKSVIGDVRVMKREWAALMTAWVKRRKLLKLQFVPDRTVSLFGLNPFMISKEIADLTERLTGSRRTATMLRHTAAMRMVDAGASALELAEFMMHADIETGQVYYDTSPTQADRINKALGLSPVYSDLTSFISGQSIDRFEMDNLDHDEQIGAAPHGRAIIGIGGCGAGQSTCAKNPGLSCYNCHKFMPLAEASVHEAARNSTTEIVQEFIETGRDDLKSPAFMQLRRTLESMDALIEKFPPKGETSLEQ